MKHIGSLSCFSNYKLHQFKKHSGNVFVSMCVGRILVLHLVLLGYLSQTVKYKPPPNYVFFRPGISGDICILLSVLLAKPKGAVKVVKQSVCCFSCASHVLTIFLSCASLCILQIDSQTWVFQIPVSFLLQQFIILPTLNKGSFAPIPSQCCNYSLVSYSHKSELMSQCHLNIIFFAIHNHNFLLIYL